MWGNPSVVGEHRATFHLGSGSVLVQKPRVELEAENVGQLSLLGSVCIATPDHRSASGTEFSIMTPGTAPELIFSQLLFIVLYVKNAQTKVSYGFKSL